MYPLHHVASCATAQCFPRSSSPGKPYLVHLFLLDYLSNKSVCQLFSGVSCTLHIHNSAPQACKNSLLIRLNTTELTITLSQPGLSFLALLTYFTTFFLENQAGFNTKLPYLEVSDGHKMTISVYFMALGLVDVHRLPLGVSFHASKVLDVLGRLKSNNEGGTAYDFLYLKMSPLLPPRPA